MPRWCRAHRALSLADNRAALVLVVLAVVADPVIIWALENQEEELEESRSVVREIAETNPMRWQSLDRFWQTLVHRFSDQHHDLEAVNQACAAIDPELPADVECPKSLYLSNRTHRHATMSCSSRSRVSTPRYSPRPICRSCAASRSKRWN